MKKDNKFTIVSNETKNSIETKNIIKVYKTRLLDVEYTTPENLFIGFDTIKAITFSYNIDFIDDIMQHFQYGEILLGANFLATKDKKLNELMEIATNSYETVQKIKGKSRMLSMLADGDLNLKSANYILDHRKIYLLKADNGKTRVIITSANMSKNAWNGDHVEDFVCDDTSYCYEEFEQEFETAWKMAIEIPYSMITGKKSDDYIEGNPIIKRVKETDEVTVVQTTPEPINLEFVRYMIDHENIKADYQEIFNGAGIKSKDGMIELKPKNIEKAELGLKKLNNRRKINMINKEEFYPKLTFDWNEKKAFINGKELDLHPTKENVCQDIEELLKVFDNFNQFVDEMGNLQETHFKFLNFMFESPFHAKLRCEAEIRGIGTMSLPIFALETSETANSGKTFMTKLVLKMMTGKTGLEGNDTNAKLDFVRQVLAGGVVGFPYFIDEINGTSFAQISKLIKDDRISEKGNSELMPVIIMAGNDLREPSEKIRKRMVFFRINGALPSSIDQNGLRTASNAIINRMGTSLYREYLGKMIYAVSDLIDYIDEKKPHLENDTWYPDLVNISSKIILEILEKYGYDIPSYMKVLKWNDDYHGANYIAENTISAIKKEYRDNPKAFVVDRDKIRIEASGSDAAKQFKSWENTLPVEMGAKTSQMRDGACFISLNRKELENRLGFRIRKRIFRS